MNHFRSLVSFGAALLLAVTSCGKVVERGGLMLHIAEDGELNIDRFDLRITDSDDKVLIERTFHVSTGEATLPATFGIVSNGDPAAVAKINISGWREDVPLDVRDLIVVQVPVNRVATVPVVLTARCSHLVQLVGDVAQSLCPQGETCDENAGVCSDNTRDARDLPDFKQGSGPPTLGEVEAPCSAEQERCDGVCVNLNDDSENCGACSVSCGEGQTCISAECSDADGSGGAAPGVGGSMEPTATGGSSPSGTGGSNPTGTGGTPTGTGGATTVCTFPLGYMPPGCGDGVLTADEICDDGNTEGGDGCAADCGRVEAGYICPHAGEQCSPLRICGDGILSEPEACDDGNDVAGDGCSPECRVELGFKCDGEPSVCTSTACGDSNREGAESCDDGNPRPFDGCSQDCQLEPSCPPEGACSAVCGDGYTTGAEECDDGNIHNGDGCSSTCRVEPGYYCTSSEMADSVVPLPVILRDFKGKDLNGGHPDFHPASIPCGGGTTAYVGLVSSTLNTARKPVWSEVPCNIASITSFGLWFADSIYTQTRSDWLTLTQSGNSHIFNAPLFFPFDGQGWVTQSPPEPTYIASDTTTAGGIHGDNQAHNFNFTSETRFWIQYEPSDSLQITFSGDDDVWVFVGGRLAIDLGGIHAPITGSVTLDSQTGGSLGLVAGQLYEVAIFHADRRPVISSYRLEVEGLTSSKSSCESVCGDGIVAANEQCDDGVENTGGYGRCGPTCTIDGYCGDGIAQMATDEQCDDGVNEGGPSASDCPHACRCWTQD